MKPHHCRYCGALLRTWHERESHLDLREANGGECKVVTEKLAPAEDRRRPRTRLARVARPTCGCHGARSSTLCWVSRASAAPAFLRRTGVARGLVLRASRPTCGCH